MSTKNLFNVHYCALLVTFLLGAKYVGFMWVSLNHCSLFLFQVFEKFSWYIRIYKLFLVQSGLFAHKMYV